MVTETSYVQSTKQVNPVTAEILERRAPGCGEPTLSAVELDGGVDDVAHSQFTAHSSWIECAGRGWMGSCH